MWPTTRPEPPAIPRTGLERDQLEAFLDYFRAALLDRAYGLSVEQLRLAPTVSRLTLAGLLSHMAWVEGFWFQGVLAGEAIVGPLGNLDFESEPDPEISWGETVELDELLATYQAAIVVSRERCADIESLDAQTVGRSRDDEPWNLRWILVHMIEEYARHCGHADLIREAIDGDLVR